MVAVAMNGRGGYDKYCKKSVGGGNLAVDERKH